MTKKKKSSPTITVEEWIEAAFTSLPEKPKNAIIVEDVVKQKKLSTSQALHRLNEMVRDGKLKKGKFILDGRLTNYYLPINK